MYRVMLVDDEENVLKSLGRLLKAAPCYYEGVAYPLEVESYTSALVALERVRAETYALVLADYRMPELDGAEFLLQVRQVQPETVRMILSGYADLDGLMKAINEAQIARFITKPWNDYELLSAIGQGLACRDRMLENRKLADRCRIELGNACFDAPRHAPAAAGRCGPDGARLCDDSSNWYG